MTTLELILTSGAAMCGLSLVGGLGLLIRLPTLQRLLLPLVAFSAGSLLGGAFLHMLPEALEKASDPLPVLLWVLVGFCTFFVLEQMLHWHACRQPEHSRKQPLGSLILLGDGVHNLVGGLAVGSAFLTSPEVGWATFAAAAAHEIPQELGDFGVLLHAGWSRKKALLLNFLSASTFLLGGLAVYWIAPVAETAFLLPFAAGNFIYLAASDLVPEVNHHHDLRTNVLHLGALVCGIALLLLVRYSFGHH